MHHEGDVEVLKHVLNRLHAGRAPFVRVVEPVFVAHHEHIGPVAAAEVAVGLGLVLQIQRRFKTLDMDQVNRLRG